MGFHGTTDGSDQIDVVVEQVFHQLLRNVALTPNNLPVILRTRCLKGLRSSTLPGVMVKAINDQMHFEAIESAHGRFPALGHPIKDTLGLNTPVMTHRQGCRSDKGNATTRATTPLQKKGERNQAALL